MKPNLGHQSFLYLARTNHIIATKALAAKLAKAVWHLMSHGGTYDPVRLFAKA